MNQLSKETEHLILTIVDTLFLDTIEKASDITLYNVMNSSNLLAMELFSHNIEEFLFYTLAQRLFSSYSEGLSKAVVQISEVLIKTQNGTILESESPTKLTFKHQDGKSYEFEIKSIHEYDGKNSVEHYGDFVKVFFFDNDLPSIQGNSINEDDFWTLVGGSPKTKHEVYQLLKSSTDRFSISAILKDTQTRLLYEWRMSE